MIFKDWYLQQIFLNDVKDYFVLFCVVFIFDVYQ